MAHREGPEPSLKVLKQMSIRRQSLERTSERMSDDLVRLQQVKEQQDKQINQTLSEMQQVQQDALQLLGPQRRYQEQSQGDANKMPEKDGKSGYLREIQQWSTADVIRWLQGKQLHKFIILFQKHHVTGQELVDLSLPFLDDYEHIDAKEREVLLTEIYCLLNPQPIYASEEDLAKIKSPFDREKYLAAVKLAQTKGDNLRKASSVLLLSSNYSSSATSSSNQSSPAMKPRHKSESATEVWARTSLPENQHEPKKSLSLRNTTKYKRAADTKKQALSNKHKDVDRGSQDQLKHSLPVPASIYDSLQAYGTHCVKCVELRKYDNTHLGVSFNRNSAGHIVVQEVADRLTRQIVIGDRVLEVNGRLVDASSFPPGVTADAYLQGIMGSGSVVKLVLARELFTENNNVDLPNREVEGENGSSDYKWNKLRSLLVQLRDGEIDPSLNIPDPSMQIHEIKDRLALQKEIKTLEETVVEHQQAYEVLKTEMDSKMLELQDVEQERNAAVTRLKQAKKNGQKDSSSKAQGGSEYYNITMAALQLDTATKEEVVESLKEIVKEASRQKWYLDRLISLVIDEAPWMLDEVDSDFDSLTVTDQSEEFC